MLPLRLGQQRLSLSELLQQLQQHDEVHCVGIVRAPPGGLHLEFDGVLLRLNHARDGFALLPPERGGCTLVVAANDVRLLGLELHGTDVVRASRRAHIVDLLDGKRGFQMKHCELKGPNVPLKPGQVRHLLTNFGVRLGAHSQAELEHVVIRAPSGIGLYCGFMSTAKLLSVRVLDSKRKAFYADGAAEFYALNCEALRSHSRGFYIDALGTCKLIFCRAVDNKVVGIELDAPLTLMKEHGIEESALHGITHLVQRCMVTENGAYGVLVRFVGADLSHTRMDCNGYNGLRITDEMLRGASAPITLTGATAIGNGRAPGASAEELEDLAGTKELSGVCVEETPEGESRAASIVPAYVRYQILLHGNSGGEWAVNRNKKDE